MSEHQTRKEEMIDLMPADGRTDALIAEKVMGCDTLTKEAVRYLCACSNREHSKGDLTGDWNEEIKPYSTDIRAAWEVVEKFVTEGYSSGGGFSSDPESAHAPWSWNLYHRDRKRNQPDVAHFVVYGWGITAPLAICRAALKVACES